MKNSSMKTTRKKIVLTFLSFLLAVGVYGGLIAFANSYLRMHGMASPFTTALLVALLILGFYKMWRWLCHRLDAYEKE